MTRITKTVVLSLAIVVLCLSAAPVFAEESSGGTSGSGTDIHQTTETERQTLKTTEAEKLQARKQAEAERKEKFCTTKRRMVGNILHRIAERGQRQIGVFTKITERTEKFKTDNNLTVDNYDSLVNTVNDKKSAAQTMVDKTKADASASASISCDSGQPKSVVGGFRDDLKSENSALKEYKTAIKNLIVAVKSSKSQAGEQ